MRTGYGFSKGKDKAGQGGAKLFLSQTKAGQDRTPPYRGVRLSRCPKFICSGKQKMTDIDLETAEAIREHLDERSAIMEYDGGLPRREAEQLAVAALGDRTREEASHTSRENEQGGG